MTEIFEFVKNVGVPGAIAFYVLARLEPAIRAHTKAVHDLTALVARMMDRMDRD